LAGPVEIRPVVLRPCIVWLMPRLFMGHRMFCD